MPSIRQTISSRRAARAPRAPCWCSIYKVFSTGPVANGAALRESQMSRRNVNAQRRQVVLGGAALAAGGLLPSVSRADEPVKVGLIVPMSGPFASTGRQIDAAVKLYQKKYGDTVAGRKIEVILKDDGGVAPDATKRIAQELIVREGVQVLAGFGLTPLAFAAAP